MSYVAALDEAGQQGYVDRVLRTRGGLRRAVRPAVHHPRVDWCTQSTALTALQRDLLTWGERARRDLPWRRTRDPWAVLVSELMLQQTQVPRVLARYERLPRTVPDAGRVRRRVGRVKSSLRGPVSVTTVGPSTSTAAAVAVCERHDGRLPDDLDALLALPGIGPYTARAVLVFAFERDIGLVDTNAGRVRRTCTGGRAARRRDARKRWRTPLVPSGHGWAWGQAVFDLGALVCTKPRPGVRRVPDLASLRVAQAGFAGTRSDRRLGRHQPAAVDVRGLVPPGPRPAGRRACAAVLSRATRSRRRRVGRTIPTRAASVGRLAGRPTAWPLERRRRRHASCCAVQPQACRRSTAATISSTAASARARISSSVRSWIGWATNTRAARRTRAQCACVAAASTNSVDATNTDGMPRASRSAMSCTLHDVHEPQSASASITTIALSSRSRGAGRAAPAW